MKGVVVLVLTAPGSNQQHSKIITYVYILAKEDESTPSSEHLVV